MKLPHLDKTPQIHPTVFVGKSAIIIGDVTIGEDSSVWFNAVIRGDVHYITIGKRTSIQDGCLLHVTKEIYPLILEDEITVGHGAILHGCHIKSRVLIGMGSKLLDNVEVGEECIIAAGSVVREGTKIPSGMLVAGVPATPKRKLKDEEIEHIKRYSRNYVGYKDVYLEKFS